MAITRPIINNFFYNLAPYSLSVRRWHLLFSNTIVSSTFSFVNEFFFFIIIFIFCIILLCKICLFYEIFPVLLHVKVKLAVRVPEEFENFPVAYALFPEQ